VGIKLLNTPTFERKPASEHICGLQWGKKKNGEKKDLGHHTSHRQIENPLSYTTTKPLVYQYVLLSVRTIICRSKESNRTINYKCIYCNTSQQLASISEPVQDDEKLVFYIEPEVWASRRSRRRRRGAKESSIKREKRWIKRGGGGRTCERREKRRRELGTQNNDASRPRDKLDANLSLWHLQQQGHHDGLNVECKSKYGDCLCNISCQQTQRS